MVFRSAMIGLFLVARVAAEVTTSTSTAVPTSHAIHSWGYDDIDGPNTWAVRDRVMRGCCRGNAFSFTSTMLLCRWVLRLVPAGSSLR